MRIILEPDSMRTYNSKLVKQVIRINEVMSIIEQIQYLNKALRAERNMISRYRKEAIVNYKAFIGFRKSLERSEVALY